MDSQFSTRKTLLWEYGKELRKIYEGIVGILSDVKNFKIFLTDESRRKCIKIPVNKIL